MVRCRSFFVPYADAASLLAGLTAYRTVQPQVAPLCIYNTQQKKRSAEKQTINKSGGGGGRTIVHYRRHTTRLTHKPRCMATPIKTSDTEANAKG